MHAGSGMHILFKRVSVFAAAVAGGVAGRSPRRFPASRCETDLDRGLLALHHGIIGSKRRRCGRKWRFGREDVERVALQVSANARWNPSGSRAMLVVGPAS